jgi:hypothetical protein
LCIESDCVVSIRGNLYDTVSAENEESNRKFHDGGESLASIGKSVSIWLILLISSRYACAQEEDGSWMWEIRR